MDSKRLFYDIQKRKLGISNLVGIAKRNRPVFLKKIATLLRKNTNGNAEGLKYAEQLNPKTNNECITMRKSNGDIVFIIDQTERVCSMYDCEKEVPLEFEFGKWPIDNDGKDLKLEVLELVFNHLDPPALIECRAVTRKWKRLSELDYYWSDQDGSEYVRRMPQTSIPFWRLYCMCFPFKVNKLFGKHKQCWDHQFAHSTYRSAYLRVPVAYVRKEILVPIVKVWISKLWACDIEEIGVKHDYCITVGEKGIKKHYAWLLYIECDGTVPTHGRTLGITFSGIFWYVEICPATWNSSTRVKTVELFLK